MYGAVDKPIFVKALRLPSGILHESFSSPIKRDRAMGLTCWQLQTEAMLAPVEA